MTAHALIGLFHVRRGLTLIVCLVFSFAGVLLLYDLQLEFDSGARGMATAEIFGLIPASLIPALTYPRFQGHEKLAGGYIRIIHTLITAATFAVPLLLAYTWAARVPDLELPPVLGLTGLTLVAMAAAYIALYTIGAAASVAAGIITFFAISIGQDRWPGSLFTELFPTPRTWETNWIIVGFLIVGAVTLCWIHRALPCGMR